jgi:hypothetical protein
MAVETRPLDLVDARPEEVGMSSERLQNVTRLVQRYVDEGKFAGAISMIARRDRVVHFETYGSMDDEAGKPMTHDAIVRAYSMTKPIASVALMQLYEEALFQLNDPVSTYIPEFAGLEMFAGGDESDFTTRAPAREMTVRDVLMHTSGLIGSAHDSPVGRMYAAAELQGSSSNGTLQEMVRKVGALPLYCDPGSEWNYGISTDILGYLVEVISGQPFSRWGCRTRGSTCGSPSSSGSRRATSGTMTPTGASDTGCRTRQRGVSTRRLGRISAARAGWSAPPPITCGLAGCWRTAGSWRASGCLGPGRWSSWR